MPGFESEKILKVPHVPEWRAVCLGKEKRNKESEPGGSEVKGHNFLLGGPCSHSLATRQAGLRSRVCASACVRTGYREGCTDPCSSGRQ